MNHLLEGGLDSTFFTENERIGGCIFIFLGGATPVEFPRPGIKPTPQECQLQILNPLSHQRGGWFLKPLPISYFFKYILYKRIPMISPLGVKVIVTSVEFVS